MKFQRCSSWKEAARIHGPWIVITAPFLLLARLPLDRIPFHVCGFRRLTGLPCPFCGATRAFCLAMDGRWLDAARMNPLGSAICLAFILILMWHTALFALRLRSTGNIRAFTARYSWWIVAALAALTAANWLYLLWA